MFHTKVTLKTKNMFPRWYKTNITSTLKYYFKMEVHSFAADVKNDITGSSITAAAITHKWCVRTDTWVLCPPGNTSTDNIKHVLKNCLLN